VLEILVHIDRFEVPSDYLVMAIRFNGRRVHGHATSPIHNLAPAQFERMFYDQPVLRVPSGIVPPEYNFVLLPAAKGFRATTEWTEPLDFDKRLCSM
jgi:hypothetical protein